jgi:hypothetical protein
MWSMTRARGVGTAVVVALAVTMAGPAPVQAAPKAKVLISAVVSGSSETVRLADPAPGQVLFDQHDTLTVEGTFGTKPLVGTLDYRVRVLLPGPGEPARFLDATTQSATFTSNQGDLSSETSWYAVPVIGFECLVGDQVGCLDHNAVVLTFGAGTGGFANLRNNALWTMRVARESSGAAVTGTLTGGIGLGFKYCHAGDATTVPGAQEGSYRTSFTLAMSSAACTDENGNLIPKETVPGGAMNLAYGSTWEVTLVPDEDPVVTLSGDRSAVVSSAAGTMSGVVTDVHFGDYPPSAFRDTLMLGGPWGNLTGIYASYQYALVRTENLMEYGEGEFPLVTSLVTPGSATVGILATY